jgi:hypothetical protein
MEIAFWLLHPKVLSIFRKHILLPGRCVKVDIFEPDFSVAGLLLDLGDKSPEIAQKFGKMSLIMLAYTLLRIETEF